MKFKVLVVLVLSFAACGVALGARLDGFNIVATPDHPFGSASAGRALLAARHLGAPAIAIIPFLWQASPSRTFATGRFALKLTATRC